MALQFILGASGTGKTKYLYDTVTGLSAKNKETTYYFIVPEQFTLQTQKELVACSPTGGILNVDVLSLARLAHKVFEEVGKKQRKILKDIGKSMVVKRALTECRSELMLFAANAGQNGFVEETKSLLSELFQYGVDEETLEGLIKENENDTLLVKKLQDILLIYRKFTELLGEEYMTAEGLYDALAECIDESSVLKDCEIVLEGFTGFTPSQYLLLKKLLAGAGKVYLSLTMTGEAVRATGRDSDLFAMSRKTMEKVISLAEEVQCEVLPYIEVGTKDYRHEEGSTLHHIQQHLFRYPVKTSEAPVGREVCVFAAGDAKEECRFAVTKIQELLQTDNYRYRNIAVIVSDMEQYGSRMAEALTAAGIPCFLDYKKNMSENTFAEYLKALLHIAEVGLSAEAVLSYVKNGLSGWKKEEVWDLENYLLAVGIKGYQFEKEWTRTYRTRTEVSLEALNAMRERILSELNPLITGFRTKDATVTDWTRMLFFFLKEQEIEWRLKEKEADFREAGDWLRVREYAQVYRVVLDLFVQLVELLGQEVLSAREYRELVETGLREAKVGLIPAGSEQIVIGDMERSRLKDMKALFFLGVNEGKVPKASGNKGLLSEKDREMLTNGLLELSPDPVTKMNQGQFYLYMNLTKPSERLYLTYSCLNEEGKKIRTSYLVGKILALFPGLTEQTQYETPAKQLVKNDAGKQAFLSGLRAFAQDEAEAGFSELYRWYATHLSEERLQVLLNAAIVGPEKERLHAVLAKELYGELITGSVTRMEQFARCAFAHFLKYGICLEERQEYSLDSPDIGNLYHDGLKRFGEYLLKEGKTWQELTDNERDDLAERSAKEAVEAYASDVFVSSARNRYLTKQMLRVLKKTLQVMTVQLAGSDFTPAAFEQAFSHTDRNLRLYGIIDRVDISKDEGKEYIKIVDYKSGNKEFSMEEMYYGLSMQLAVYMAAVLRDRPENAIPAGMFYYRLADPIVRRDGHPERAVLEELRVKGLVSGNPEVIRRLDHEFCTEAGGLSEAVKSFRIPVETDKSGQLKATSKVADKEQFLAVTDFVYEKLKEETEQILAGAVEIAPFKLKKKTGCDYCPYASVCGFDKKRGGKYRALAPLSDEEVFEKLCDSRKKGD